MSEFVTLSDGARLWTKTTGAGEPLVLLGGGPGLADYLAPVAELFDSRHTVCRFEQRGCGRSERRGPYRLQRFVDDIDELRVHWGAERWNVVGHSFGVDLGLAYALRYPDRVSGLVGLAGGRIHDDRGWSQVYQAQSHLEALPDTGYPHNPEVNRALNADWKAFCRQPGLLRSMSELAVATRFIWGDLDIRLPWPTQQLAALLPNAEFLNLPCADHYLWHGNPTLLGKMVCEFLERDS